MAQQWRCAEGVLIPKEEDSKRIDQFRMISMLSVEGKIFFSLVARWLSDFLSSNNYIDTSVQKRGISGVPGWLEHTGVVMQLIREACENKGDLTVLWLDLTNAYGSIPPQTGDHHDQTPCAKSCCRLDPGLLRSIHVESLSRSCDIGVA